MHTKLSNYPILLKIYGHFHILTFWPLLALGNKKHLATPMARSCRYQSVSNNYWNISNVSRMMVILLDDHGQTHKFIVGHALKGNHSRFFCGLSNTTNNISANNWLASREKVPSSMRKLCEDIVLHMRKVSSGPLLSIDTVYSIQWFC